MDAQNVQRFKKAVEDDKATFYFIPNATLKEKIVDGSDPVIAQLPAKMKESILLCKNGDGIITSANLVMSLLDGTIDLRNKHVLSFGEIRVVGVGDMNLAPRQIPNE